MWAIKNLNTELGSIIKLCDVNDQRAAAQTFQFALPNLSFQSLITPGGNSRLPTPVRRQASGHISSKE